MHILRKIYEDETPIFYIQTDLGLIIKVKSHTNLTPEETEKLLEDVALNMDDKLKNNIE
ncbi:hypothetical protein MHZ36_09305 [Staphylococcus sp. ACRSN]|uniref:hypothetical protein n=1 Tax=Staphylococcus sp. ACRSN TaxID=2918214 RepID=UPI001EF28C0E|nr:hypothetical protein [Staphylococcus sp. ACRSN]MCG7339489.1 hypothetical protein [Staphylococcus sp. ACRSN]